MCDTFVRKVSLNAHFAVLVSQAPSVAISTTSMAFGICIIKYAVKHGTSHIYSTLHTEVSMFLFMNGNSTVHALSAE